jgi:hypothetical protein
MSGYDFKPSYIKTLIPQTKPLDAGVSIYKTSMMQNLNNLSLEDVAFGTSNRFQFVGRQTLGSFKP